MDEVASLADGAPELLDLRGLKCPMPVLRTRRALRRLAAGQSLRVLCTDPLAGIDIPNLVREDGHRLASAERADGIAVFVVVKRAAEPPRAPDGCNTF